MTETVETTEELISQTEKEMALFESRMKDIEETGRYQGLKEKISEERYQDVIKDLALFEIVFQQVSTIFYETMYNQENEVIKAATDDYIGIFMKNFTEQFIELTIDSDQVAPIPELDNIVTWSEQIHTEIASYTFGKEFVENVISKALGDISEAILETAQEGESEVEETIEETTDGN